MNRAPYSFISCLARKAYVTSFASVHGVHRYLHFLEPPRSSSQIDLCAAIKSGFSRSSLSAVMATFVLPLMTRPIQNTGRQSAPFHSSSGPYFGQKILVLVIVDLKARQALPISYAFLTAKKDPDHVPGHYRALDLIEAAIHDGFPPLAVAADSWFDSKEFIQAIKDLGCVFAGELKSNRLARINSNPGSPRQKLKAWFENLSRVRLSQSRFQKRKEKRGKAFSLQTLFLKDLNLPLRAIAVYNRINGTQPFAFYATTDLSMTGARLWKYSRARWAIEVLFRDLKQSLAFGELTAGGEGGAHMAVCIPLILLTSIRLDSKDVWESNGKESLGTTVKRHRELALSNTIDAIVHNPNAPRVQRLRARRKNPNQKPTNVCGEKISA